MGEQIEEIQETQEEVQEQIQEQPNYEERAKLQGWVPEDEFRGDKERWITAKEFVDRADHMMPILKATNRKLESKVSDYEKELTETKQTLDKVISIQEKYSTDLHDTKLSEIREQKRQAVVDGNPELYDRLDKQEQELPKPEPLDVKQEEKKDEIPPEMDRWFKENAWYFSDKQLNEDANDIGNAMAKRQHPLTVPGQEYALGEEIKKKLKVLYPEKFTNQSQQTSDVDETNIRDTDTINTDKKGWNDLPPEAKQYYQNRGQYIPGLTKEKYINDYFEA
jgi:hypothetical protein